MTAIINNLNYELDAENKTASVCRIDNNDKYWGDIVIPSYISHKGVLYGVISIGEEAFRGCTSLTAITIPDSIIEIGHWAFEGCANLTSIVWNAKSCESSFLDYTRSDAVGHCIYRYSSDYDPFYGISFTN